MVIDLNNLSHGDTKKPGDMFFNSYFSLIRLYDRLEILNFCPREAIDATDAFLYAQDKEPNIRCSPLIKINDACGMLSSFEVPINGDIDFCNLFNAFDVREAYSMNGMLGDNNINGDINMIGIDFCKLKNAPELFRGTKCNNIHIKDVNFGMANLSCLFWGTKASKVTLDNVNFSDASFTKFGGNIRFTNIGLLDIRKNCKWPPLLTSSILDSLFGKIVRIDVVRIDKEDKLMLDAIKNFSRTEKSMYTGGLSVDIKVKRIELV